MTEEALNRQDIYIERTSLSQFETDAPVVKELISQLRLHFANTQDADTMSLQVLNDAYYLCTLAIVYRADSETLISTPVCYCTKSGKPTLVHCITWCLLRLHQDLVEIDGDVLNDLKKKFKDDVQYKVFCKLTMNHLEYHEAVINFCGKKAKEQELSTVEQLKGLKGKLGYLIDKLISDYEQKCEEADMWKSEVERLTMRNAELESALATIPENEQEELNKVMSAGGNKGVFMYKPQITHTENDNKESQVFNGQITDSKFDGSNGGRLKE